MGRISIGKRVAALARHLRMLRNRCLKEAGCTIGEAYFHLFMFFNTHPDCNEKQAAAAIGKDKTFVAKAVKKLIAQGMIVIRKDETDARYKRIRPTQKGKEESEKAALALASINDIISRGIDQAQIDAFLNILGMMHRNVLGSIEKE